MVGTALASPHAAPPTTPSVSPAQARDNAHNAAASLVADRPAALAAADDDTFVETKVESGPGVQFVNYARKHKGLPVVDGDLVVQTDPSGRVLFTSVAQDRPITGINPHAKLDQAQAAQVAAAQLSEVDSAQAPVLSVLAAQNKLVWNTRVAGTKDGEPSVLDVYVDAQTGAVAGTSEHVVEGTGDSAYSGTVTIGTTNSGGTYKMQDPNQTSVVCQDAANNTTFSGSDDAWGNGDATSRETGCVDALFAAEKEREMLSQWLGRNGFDGNGGGWPIRVGLDDVNAYYNGYEIQIGHSQGTSKWISAIDVVGHEAGHGVDDHTGSGGVSGGGTREFIADALGTSTEFFINASTNDTPDYTIGESVNLVGAGPIRYMYKPSLVSGHPDCYSSSVPNAEVHAAAGPGNHWFYLLAEGTNPGSGKPTSATCNGTSNLAGIGIKDAQKILYGAMQLKTSGSNYGKYRTWTLQSAKTLFPNSCDMFNKVKAAWDAVSLGAQTGEPTCSGTPTTTTPPTSTTTPKPPTGCSGQKLTNGGFESGATGWSGTTGAIGQWGGSGQPAHGGTYDAWLAGYGYAATDTLSQNITIPAGCKATLAFWLHIDTAETTTSAVYDKLTVQAGSTTLATYSNLNKGTGYTQKSIDLSAFAGQTVTIKFTGAEDSSLKTSFVLDDAAVNLS
ncbi:zinc metalloprotease [Lentzea aerocolonigenes]|uniref:Zinc metalloprotease n=1 Tax=Lentzea aerocolonigenes TaxID=68170 RepID=A0A0F0HBQ8_LENAE|nr:zinc metalloprotease [Lentzea aerocolonigenes]